MFDRVTVQFKNEKSKVGFGVTGGGFRIELREIATYAMYTTSVSSSALSDCTSTSNYDSLVKL